MKKILFTILVAATFNAAAQTIPSNIPTNGLVAWYPFNGNANDESGNGNNGTVNGATLTSDRNGQANKAYNFNGSSSYISANLINTLHTSLINGLTLSGWTNSIIYSQSSPQSIIGLFDITNSTYAINYGNSNGTNGFLNGFFGQAGVGAQMVVSQTTPPNPNTWYHVVMTCDFGFGSNISKLYINGICQTPIVTNPLIASLTNLVIGKWWNSSWVQNGKLDDIGIWHRALTQQEITDLYGASNCANNTTITPQINSITTGSTASFTATTSDANPSYVWQTNFGQGFQTLNNFASYSGVNTSTLNIANVQLANHNQPIRVITTSGTCIDTSNIASIHIADTCISTQLVTVTDTLIIHANLTGISPPNNSNTIKVYPNPAQNYLIINNGNFALMSGYTCEIVNALGQQIFSSLINQQTFTIDISTWTGNGLYFLKIKDTSNTVIENRKIVLN
jgi:hypothetical protein